MNVHVRCVREEDIYPVAHLVEEFANESVGYGRYNHKRMVNSLLACIYEPTRFLGLVAVTEEGEYIGFLHAFMADHAATDIQLAHDLGLFIKPEYRKQSDAAVQLIDEYVVWGLMNGAARITLCNGAGITDAEHYDRLMKRVEFGPVGILYAYGV